MLRRCLILAAISIGSLSATVWTDRPAMPVAVTADQAVWKEYGFEEAATANFGRYKATAYRFQDATGAVAAAQWIGGIQGGNYVLICSGKCPKEAQIRALTSHLAHFFDHPGPTLPNYLPPGRVPRSERYILGPASLSAFAPEFPADDVAFQFSTEGQVAKYKNPKGDLVLALFSYPAPQMARQQLLVFQRLPGVQVKRAGPLVAVIPAPADVSAAQRLLGQVNYQASVTLDQPPPPRVTSQSVARLIISILILAGIILVFCTLAGVVYAGIRILRRRFGNADAEEEMIVLHLSDE